MVNSSEGGANAQKDIGNLPPEQCLDDNKDEEKVDYVPAAIPQEREMEQTKSYFAHKLACVTFAVLAIVAVVGGVCGSGHCSSGSSKTIVAVTSAPTSLRSTLSSEFELKLLEAFGPNYLDDDHESIDVRLKALEWILDEDPMQLESDAENLIQRYVLAVFYFQTSQQSPWTECDPAGPKSCRFTVHQMHEPEPGNAWLSDIHECFWGMLRCDGYSNGNRDITHFFSTSAGMNGQIPTEVVKLTELRQLRLVNSSLTGTIPTELAELTTLESLDVAYNPISGAIPPELFGPLQDLWKFSVHGTSLAGSIPATIGLFPGKMLWLGNTDLSGAIPTELYSIKNLTYFIISNTDITGTLASDFANLDTLRYLYIDGTSISGTIPSEIGAMESLHELICSGTQMSGTLPEEIFTAELRWLDVANCAFSGTVSTSIGLCTSLNAIDLSNNNFEGSIPTEIAALTELHDIFIQGNDFAGTFPESFCANTLSSDRTDIGADCLPDEGTNNDAMECKCCTECCNAVTGICQQV